MTTYYRGITSRRASKLDGTNLIAFGGLEAGVIAVTRVWYNTSTFALVEADIIFNKSLPWAVFEAALGECATTPHAFDVADIGTHEAGHVFGLDHPPDLTGDGLSTQDLTMFRFASGGELKKRSLGLGDITGALAVLP